MNSKSLYISSFLTIFTLGLLLFVSCSKENTQPKAVFQGKEYFPLRQGDYIVYEITKINIDKPSNIYDTIVYLLKEIIDIPIIDNEEDTAYRVERYIFNPVYSNWEIQSVWQAKLSNNAAQKVEENLRFVKIHFPVHKKLQWDGNIYNELDPKTYKISDLNVPFQINQMSFDSCLFVLQDSSSSLIHKNYAVEIYAYKIGLVYKEETYINSQEVIFDVPIEQRITTGTIYKQKIIEYNVLQ
jgi:hypothetical protein